jgi:hypothetical protein
MKNYSDLDKVLFEIQDRGLYSIDFDIPENEIKAFQRLLRLGLIYERLKNTYDLTEEGQQAVDMGGFAKWQKQKEHEESRERAIKDRTLFQLKYWWLVLIVSAIVGFVSGNFLTIIGWFR